MNKEIINKLRGAGVALVTPFLSNKKIDFDGLRQLIEHCIEGGLDYLVSMGTTGEAATLSLEERYQILDFTVDVVAQRVPVIAGFGGNNTQQLLRDVKNYHFKGISAILSASPAYNKPNQTGIYEHYKALASHTPLPILLYNVPGRTSSNITASTALQLGADFPNIIGIKEASGNLVQCMEIVKNRPKIDFLVISGDDILTLPMVAFGMDGVISVIANAYPKQFGEMVHHALNQNFEAARPLHYELFEVIELIFKDGNPAGIKAVLKELGICQTADLRLPLTNVSATILGKLKQVVQKNQEKKKALMSCN